MRNSLDKSLRDLVKEVHIQNIFSIAQEINSIRIFENSTDLSKLQNTFLSYLYYYKSIFSDIATKKISEKIIDNDIYVDAYSLYKKYEDSTKKEKETKPKDLHLVFKKGKGKEKH